MLCTHPLLEWAKPSQFQLLFSRWLAVLSCDYLLAIWGSLILTFIRCPFYTCCFLPYIHWYHEDLNVYGVNRETLSRDFVVNVAYKFWGLLPRYSECFYVDIWEDSKTMLLLLPSSSWNFPFLLNFHIHNNLFVVSFGGIYLNNHIIYR